MALVQQIGYDQFNTLFSGYFRHIESILQKDLPKAITQIIIAYQAVFLAHGVGDTHIFGGNLKQFTLLKQLEDTNPHTDIHRNNDSLLIINQNQELYAIGHNVGYRLGISNERSPKTLTKVAIENVKLVSTGCENDNHTFVYTLNHELYASGYNYSGYLGNGAATNNYSNTHILLQIDTNFLAKSDEHISKITCGQSWSLFLTNYGYIYSCGAGRHGHSQYRVLRPKLLNMNNDNVPIIDIDAGYYHSLALDKKQRLIGFGDNEYGQINIEPSQSNELPQFHKYFAENDIKIKYITAGYCHNLCIDIDDNCYLFGANTCGQIGNGEILEEDTGQGIPFKINDIINDTVVNGSCGDDHSIILTKSNKVYTFGKNTSYQCSTILKEKKIKMHAIDKELEIGALETSVVEKVMAVNNGTIVFINPFQNLNLHC